MEGTEIPHVVCTYGTGCWENGLDAWLVLCFPQVTMRLNCNYMQTTRSGSGVSTEYVTECSSARAAGITSRIAGTNVFVCISTSISSGIGLSVEMSAAAKSRTVFGVSTTVDTGKDPLTKNPIHRTSVKGPHIAGMIGVVERVGQDMAVTGSFK